MNIAIVNILNIPNATVLYNDKRNLKDTINFTNFNLKNYN